MDTIDLAAIDAITETAGDQAFTFIESAAFSGVAGQLRFNGTKLLGDVNGDRLVDSTIQLVGGVALAQDDLLL